MISETPKDKKVLRIERDDVLSSSAYFSRLEFSDIYTTFNPTNARTCDPESNNRSSVFRKREFNNCITPELRPATLVMSSSDDEKENSIIPNTPTKRIRTHGRFESNK
jgi:hypothetical protein